MPTVLGNPKQFNPYDLWFPASEDWVYESIGRVNAINQRHHSARTWGIVRANGYVPPVPASPPNPAYSGVNIPVSPINPAPPRLWDIRQFMITLNMPVAGVATLTVGSDASSSGRIIGGLAFDISGDLIYIPDQVPYNPVISVAYGTQSTGNVDIPIPGPGVWYLWINHLDVNDPSVSQLDESGGVHYPQLMDGYQIMLTPPVPTPTPHPVSPNGDGFSLFLCKITYVGGTGTITVIDGQATDGSNTIDTRPTEIKRVFSAVRDTQVEVVVDNNPANRTPVYGDGFIGSLKDHVQALGGGSPTPNNPHGLTLSDIPGAGTEPVAEGNQNFSLDKGLVDKNAPQNSPAYNAPGATPPDVTSAQCSVAQTPSTSLQPAGIDSAVTTISTNLQTAWIRVIDLHTTKKAAFLGGKQLKRLYPTVRQTGAPVNSDPSIDPGGTPDPESGDGWVGFDNTIAPGYWIIYGSYLKLSTGVDVLLLNKAFDDPSFDPTDKIVLTRVYWDGLAAWRNATKTAGTALDDLRSLGLVGPQQISTEAKANPNTGIISQTVIENLVANSNFFLDTNGSPVSVGSWSVNHGNPYVFDALEPKQINSTDDPTLPTNGPAAISGMQFTARAGASSPSFFYQLLQNLKPDKWYGLSFWYWAESGFNARMQLDLSSNKLGAPGTLLDAGVQEFTVRDTSAWQRASIVFKTASGVNADPAVAKYLAFIFDQPNSGAVLSKTFRMTNVMLTEGEWIPGYMPGRYVPSGSIIGWDLTDNCPPGFVPVTGAVDRFPVGAGNVARGVGAGTFNPASPVIAGTTGSESQPHHHKAVDVSWVTPDLSGSNNYNINMKNTQTDLLTDDESQGHTHAFSVAGNTFPYYGMIYCRAI